MEALKLSGFAFVLFVMAFFGISWATKGMPTLAMRAAPAVSEPAVPGPASEPAVAAAVVAAIEPVAMHVPQPLPRPERPAAAREDNDPRRQALRHAALRAANEFELAPCDPATKRALINALADYAKAWTEMAGCKQGVCSGDPKLDRAAGAFSTQADARVRVALRSAFDKGGVGRDDFPPAMRLPVTMLIGDPGDSVSVCTTGRRADATR